MSTDRDADPFGLDRFVTAQDAGGTYRRATAELTGGRKTSHWMWFVFPQIAGLGRSEMSRRYAISSIGEAKAYLAHPVLGPRLLEATAIVAGLRGSSAAQIFGGVDARKLQSCMTLFARAAPSEPMFDQVLTALFTGRSDEETDRALRA